MNKKITCGYNSGFYNPAETWLKITATRVH